MTKSTLLFLRLIVNLLVCGALLTSCSNFCEEDSEPIDLEPIVCTEEPINITVELVDKRWCKKGGYGMPNISIYLKRDLALLLKEPLVLALEGNNLNNIEDGVKIEFEVEQFFCDVMEHRRSWNCVSELIFNVRVIGSNGQEFYSRRINGFAENDFEMTEKNGKSRKALETALEDAMRNLLDDKSFRRAIKKASLL